MDTTANTYFVKSENSWSGNLFVVTNRSSEILFRTSMRGSALSACSFLNNNADYIKLKDGQVFLNNTKFMLFNSLLTKNSISKPLKRDLLLKSVININSQISICFNTGLISFNSSFISFINEPSLEAVFNLIKIRSNQ